MSKKLQLKKLVLETADGQKVELTMDEARALHEQLDALFGEKTKYIPSSPVIIERERSPRPSIPTPIWCGMDTGKDDITVLCDTGTGLKATWR